MTTWNKNMAITIENKRLLEIKIDKEIGNKMLNNRALLSHLLPKQALSKCCQRILAQIALFFKNFGGYFYEH